MNESFSGTGLCVVGNVNRDVKVQGVPATADLLRDGETPVTGIVETIGGGGANSACVAAALGANVAFAGKVGADALGDRLRQALEECGVRPRLVSDPHCATGTTVALGYDTGDRHFLSCLHNNASLSFDDLDLAALDGCTHLLRADVWFSQAMLEGGNRRLLATARERGLTTSLDINFDPHRSGGAATETARRKRLLRDVLDLVDLAHGNVRELCEFTEGTDLDTALQSLVGWGVPAVVVHMGAQGAGYYSGGELIVEPPCPVQRVVNATGTGDVLSTCMMLLHARQDLSVRQKLRLSNQVVAEFIEGRRTMIPAL